MKEVDARGLSCPETFDADSRGIKRSSRTCENSCHRAASEMNVEKFAKDKGKKPTSVQKDGYYEVVIE